MQVQWATPWFFLKVDILLLPKEHHQNYWKFTVNNIKKQLILFLWKCTLYWFKYYITTCVSTAEFYQQMSKSNSSNGNDQMVLFDWYWSRFMNKFSLIRRGKKSEFVCVRCQKIKMIKVYWTVTFEWMLRQRWLFDTFKMFLSQIRNMRVLCSPSKKVAVCFA